MSADKLAPRGRLRVSVPQSFGDRIFYPQLRAFMARYPELSVEVVITDRSINLVEEGIDCAIRGADLPADSGLVARKLASVHWITCASPDYLEVHGQPQTIADLSCHDCLQFVSPSSGRALDWEFIENGKKRRFRPAGRLRLTSLDGVVEAAAAGAGIAQAPDAVACEALREGSLHAILTPYIAPAPSLLLVYPGNRYLTARVRAFADFFAGVFPLDGWWAQLEQTGGPGPHARAG